MVAHPIRTVSTLIGAGVVTPVSPMRLARMGRSLTSFGQGPVSAFEVAAIQHPRALAIIDEAGSLTYEQVSRRSWALASALRNRGVRPGDSVGLMCRNHRWFIEATLALLKLGANVCFLNTAFSGPQLCDVVERESCRAIVLDAEFLSLVDDLDSDVDRYLAWRDEPVADVEACSDLVAAGDPAPVKAPRQPGRMTILTSGTTGRPKGVGRGSTGLDAGAALLSRIPLKARGRTVIAAPMFHTWGWAHMMLGALLCSTLVLPRRFDPVSVLELTERSRADALVVIPVFLQRILDAEVGDAGASLRDGRHRLDVVASSGSALTGDLAQRWMDAYGDSLFNTYGSTEVAWCSIATPVELRSAPGAAGRPPFGTQLRLLDDADREVAPGERGRIFVGNSLTFEGYNDGSNKDVVDGLISTGDLGHLDDQGLLHVDGRDDDMIVSGGENVYPQEVEDSIATMPGITDVCVVPVEDADFSHRLRAYVVASQQSHAPEPDAIKQHVRGELAAYKVPRDVVFLTELPRNATGKVLRRELIARH